MKQTITKSILLSAALLLFLCKTGRSQMGIGTPTPSALLDLTSSNPAAPASKDGFLAPRVSAFPATNPGASQNGMLIYLTATVGAYSPGFYYWDNPTTSWKKFITVTAPSATSGYATRIVSASGGTDLVYGAGDWANNTYTDLPLATVSDPTSIYNAATGVITITQAGLYHVTTVIVLSNDPGAGAAFDGTSGLFSGILQVKPNGSANFATVSYAYSNVLRGASAPGGFQEYYATNTATLNLQPGDKVKIAFMTYATGNMNTVTNNITIDKASSSIDVFKL